MHINSNNEHIKASLPVEEGKSSFYEEAIRSSPDNKLYDGNKGNSQPNSEKLNLSICLRQESPPNPYGHRDSNPTLLAFSIRNGGNIPSYISSVGLEVIIDGETRTVIYEISRRSFPTNQYLKEEEPLLPGQCHTYLVDARRLSAQLQAGGENIVLKEAYVEDEIGNKYSTAISSDLATWLLGFPPGKKYPYSLF